MQGLEGEIDERLQLLKSILQAFAKSKCEFDLAMWISFYTFDVLGVVGFSRSFRFLETGVDADGIIQAVQITTPLLIAFSHVSWLVKVVRSQLCRAIFGSPSGIRK